MGSVHSMYEDKVPRVAFVHDWLIDKGGAETLLGNMLEIFEDAPVYSLLHDADGPTLSILEGHPLYTSFLQKIPKATKFYRSLLPLMPVAIEQFDLQDYDIVISSSHAVAKGVITGADQLHISYVNTPIRYAWEMQHQYLRQSGLSKGVKSLFARIVFHYIRNWDVQTSHGVDYFIANSKYIARRIRKAYRRKAVVIYPPVDVDKFSLETQKGNYYLTASRMVSYKKIDMIVDAFSYMPDKKLVVIGTGPDFRKIEKKASANVELLGYQPFEILKKKMQQAKAFIFAAEEDFGIVSVEAQACGTPVIAYGKGGALETVLEGETGLFFYEQTPQAIVEAVKAFDCAEYVLSPKKIRENAERFSRDRFQREISSFVQGKWDNFQLNREA